MGKQCKDDTGYQIKFQGIFCKETLDASHTRQAVRLRMKRGGQPVKTDRLGLAHSHNHKGYKLYSDQIHIFTQITFHYLK